MKIFTFISIFVCSTLVMSQDLHVRTFVKKDTLQVRWFPTSASIMKSGLVKGYSIQLNDGQSSEEIKIEPWSQRRKSYIGSDDSLTVAMSEIIDEFAELQESSSSAYSTLFGLLTLSSSAYVEVAEMLGCRYVIFNRSGKIDIQIKTGEYISERVLANTKKLDKNAPFSELEGSSRPDLEEAYLKWEAKSLNPYYGGYYILKSTDKKNFNELNKLPLFHFTSDLEKNKTFIDYVDNEVEEGNTYYYKVIPINHFGDAGEHSNVVEVYIQKRLNGVCVIDTVSATDYNRQIVGYYESEFQDEISEFALYRSDSVNQGFQLIEKAKRTTSDAFSFQYKVNLTSGDRHFFMVAAIGVDGDTVYSFPYYHFSLDQIPPGIPTELTGSIDSLGVVTLNWIEPGDDDLRGYRVFKSNSLDEEFVEVTEYYAETSIFYDTIGLNNLSSAIYYKVRAVDMNYNNGPITPPLKLMKPDTIPPVPPVFQKYEVKEEGIYLKWANSPSKDVKKVALVRQLEGFYDTILFINQQTEFVDTSCLLGRRYTYSFVAFDESNNSAASKGLFVSYEIGYRPAPKGFTGAADREKKAIQLHWNVILDDIYSIQIYRAKNDGKFRLYKTLRENVNEYVDHDLSINNIYKYKIKVMYKSGHSSKMSTEITIVY